MNTKQEDSLLEDLRGEDELGVVVRSHIHIENYINELISLLLPTPEFVDKMKLEYDQKVSLVIACGLKKELAPPLNCFGTVRNSFAHKLNTEISKSLVSNLYRSFCSDDKEVIQNTYKKLKESFKKEGYPKFNELEPRDQYILIVLSLRGALLAAILSFEKT